MKAKQLLYTSLVVIALIIVPSAFAQEITAGLQGTVKDPSGAVIAKAGVEIIGPALAGGRTTTTDGSGLYRFPALPPGEYTVTVSAPGFRKYRQTGIELQIGRFPNLDLQLQVGAVAETVEVSGQAPTVDVTQSKVAVTLDKDILNNIPKGRSFESVVAFAPGARGEALQAGGFQIDGASNGENLFMVDGINITNIQNGGLGKSFQMDFVDEVQVKSSSFEAEFGAAIGGVIQATGKRGSNDYHGSVLTYLRMNKFNANNGDRGLQTDPTGVLINTTTRLDGAYRYFYGAKDDRTILEPGFTLGGPILKDKLQFFTSYIPTLDTTWRTTTFIGANPGPRRLSQNFTQHNAYSRLDYAPLNTLRLYSSWNYSYSRTSGALGAVDSAAGQRPTAAATSIGSTTDPNTLRSDVGSVNPNSLYSFGADWTPTSKLVVSARYGYLFQNNEQRGIPVGTRYLYSGTLSATSKDITGAVFPSTAPFNATGFANIPSNLAYIYDAYDRKSLNLDVSYFVHFAGSHNFKGGYFRQEQENAVLRNLNGGSVNLYYAQNYQPSTSTSACDGVIAQNRTTYGTAVANAAGCTGKYGYFAIGNNVTNTGGDSQTAQAVYFQDSWQVAGIRGLTLNLGVRFDQETTPAYDPARFPSVTFGWGDKIAPRLGGAYDVLHNGKLKVYASYGKFYDLQKMGLARGSFGSDYWHNCVYAMDDPDYTKITPSLNLGGGCPASGPAPGVTVGRFIENLDLRATKADPRDPAVDANIKPMLQHEFVAGGEWAINKDWSLTTRYVRKRLDRTIEDMSITDSLGFYIGNPGSTIADVLHRPVSIPCGAAFNGVACVPDAAGNYLTTTPFCAECPGVQAARRQYDSIEFRLAKRFTGHWFGAITYDYSKLTGNYTGLTNSDPTDGGTGGRASPNNSRQFDLPQMSYLANGKPDDGPFNTNRPHTGSLYAFYQQKWGLFGKSFGTSSLGVNQIVYEGGSISTCIAALSASACQWAEGRGNFVTFTRDAATGNLVNAGVKQDARAPLLTQTDITLRHDFPVKERQMVTVELNATNLLNQRAVLGYREVPNANGTVSPARASRFSGDPNIDWGRLLGGYNYTDAMNGTGVFSGTVNNVVGGTRIQAPLTLSNQYGLPNSFQTARSLRLAFRYTF